MILYFPLTVLSMLNGSVLLTFTIILFFYLFVCFNFKLLSFKLSFLFLSVVRGETTVLILCKVFDTRTSLGPNLNPVFLLLLYC
jgi:hypothetical protein